MLTHILKNLTRRKTRTLLTTAGIAIGVAMIVALGAMGEGLRTGYLTMFSGSGADLTIMQKGAYDITISSVPEEVVQQVAQMPEVQSCHRHDGGQRHRAGFAVLFCVRLRSGVVCDRALQAGGRIAAGRDQDQRPQRARDPGWQAGRRVAEVKSGRCPAA